jgi:hypothetical protein
LLLQSRKMVSKLRVTFPKSPSLLFFFLTNSCHITVLTGIRRCHPEPSTALGPSFNLLLVRGELTMSRSPSLYLPFVEWCPKMLFHQTPMSSGGFRPWHCRRATVDGRRGSPFSLDEIWAVQIKCNSQN